MDLAATISVILAIIITIALYFVKSSAHKKAKAA